ncbi:asparagine synthase (glutamine-hydrolyzing) [Lysinibacillus sp. 2017]|uniref:asparagine synthase (glutamine-hydrolyzing) n=1 Tax=unclassified Lysinibacillus TaxID=2636778 RepID=UPI000D52822D|nr:MULTISPECIES: asparagine synthase (glutamine-hydrolyzing) [unclassified Lysinibacillus]AWE05908.1 asparagine synthase (glutamine-hydrolyzing) [Lysinibacillus sp. 2017]TGN31868.1 asparagine synthase (glutamine-hydrolyzing) [Lysinibacillus sp. S2017]
MCGFVGWIDFMGNLTNDTKVIEKMNRTLTHRGPDAEGYYKSKHILLGHQRLAIIDLQGGNQPMTKQGITIVYNGEIYNASEIREKLIAYGHSFDTTSDTEVLLTAYIHWKEKCVDVLNGIFAFAIWDERDESLFLCRDRLGVKPLFYQRLANGILVSSEIKGLLAHPLVKASVDTNGLAALLSLGPSRIAGHAIFKGIEELKPAHAMIVTKQETKVWRYWEIESKVHVHTLEETRAQVRELVENAVIRQLISDVPICTMLSGGLDSSIITAIAAKQLSYHDKTLATFSVSYEDNDAYFKENAFQTTQDGYWIDQMRQRYKTDHRTITLTQDALVEALKDAMLLKDMPSMADIDSSLYLFCQEMKNDFSVGLSGECADEVFGGYPWFYEQQHASVFPWLRSTSEREAMLNPIWQQRLQLPAFLHATYEQALTEMPVFIGDEVERERQKLFYLNNQFFMQTLLERNDRMTMGASMEVRVPFADHTVIEYVWNIPWEMKNSGGMEKGILRQAFADVLPKEVVYRKKNPYPKTYHPRYTELVQNQLQQILLNKESILYELFDKEKLQQLITSGGKSFHIPWFGQLMAGPQLLAYLIQLHEWVEHYDINIVSA